MLVEVEHRLLPMRVGCLRSRTEPEPLVGLRELHIEECHQRLDEVVTTHLLK